MIAALALQAAIETAEPGSVEAIAAATTDPKFSSPWVAYVPESPDVPSPTDVLGRIAGAPGELSTCDQIYGYFHALDQASDRVQVWELGRTEEDRPILLAAIADQDGIRELPRLKQATKALADPRRTTPEQARAILERARPIYYFNAALHADESGSPEMVMELAYRLAVSEQPMIRAIRERLVVLINPVSNPDGRDKMAHWFYRHLKGRTDYPALPRQSPPYWGPYVFVDANRDAHQLAFEPTRAVHRMFHDFHPTVVHDLHEAIPLLQTWNGTGPYNPNLDPIVLSEFLELSFHEVTALTALGMPGVWTWKFGEGFGHHYLDSLAMNHNSLGRGYETFGNAVAETVERELEPGDLSREWYRPWPPERRFRWSMRDNVNYQQTAALAILDYAAKHADWLLHNFYRKGYNSWRRGLDQPPHAYVIPPDQGDPGRVAHLIDRLLAQRIEIHRAAAATQVGAHAIPAGALVVRLDQPYRNYAVDLLEPQHFPPDAEHEPYDDVSWALPIHYGIEATRIDERAVFDLALESVTGPLAPRGRVTGGGPAYLLADTGQEALLAARFRLKEFELEIAEQPFELGGRSYPRGSWILPPRAGLRDRLEQVAAELALDFEGVGSIPPVARHTAPAPRIGVWVPWADTDAIGWIRYTFDRQKVPYVYLRDQDIRAGQLEAKLDVIVYGQVLLDLQGQIHGLDRRHGPLAFTRTDQFPSHGRPASAEDITGGIGWSGLAQLDAFVHGGGILVTLGNGSTLALEGGLVRHVRRADATGVSTPGAELAVRLARPDHPIGYGYAGPLSAFRSNYPVYDPPRAWLTMSYCTSCLDGPIDRSGVVLEWGALEGQALIVSGGGRKLDQLDGRPAIFDLPLGRGRVVAFNFNPLHRDLNYSDHRFLWNVLLNWSWMARP